MDYRRLGRTGLKVSEIGLGTNTFGGRLDEAQSVAVVHRAIDLGVNYIDTADVYNRGRAEEFVGKATRGKRSEVVIATKFGLSTGKGPNDTGNSRYHIMQAVNASLKRLGTDYIDVYHIHHPDATPIDETLRTLDDLVRAGKIRYIGCSTFTAWQLCEAYWTSKTNNLEPVIVAMTEYNLIHRQAESELIPCCEAYGIGVIPYRPLAAGFLSDDFDPEKPIPPGSRFAEQNVVMRQVAAEAEASRDKLKKLRAFAEERGHRIGDLAIAWLLSHPWLNTVIAGATAAEQLSANIASASWKLTAPEAAELR